MSIKIKKPRVKRPRKAQRRRPGLRRAARRRLDEGEATSAASPYADMQREYGNALWL